MEVHISADAWSSCLAHALSTEHEEIMGLLLGDCIETQSQSKVDKEAAASTMSSNNSSKKGKVLANKKQKVVAIWASMAFQRSDRRKDRVEISADQLYAGSKRAEVGAFCIMQCSYHYNAVPISADSNSHSHCNPNPNSNSTPEH